MSYQGYLLKINGIVFPKRLIKIETYNIAPNQKQTIDAYVDGNGGFHQTTLPHRRTKIEFNTPCLKTSDIETINAFFPNETNILVEYWNPKKSIYETSKFYTPDIEYSPLIDNGTDIIYFPIRIALIEN